MRSPSGTTLVATLALITSSARAQYAGPPAGVPVPPAPVAADRPTPEGRNPVVAGDTHFRIRLLDGRSGLPIRSAKVRLWYDERDTPGYLLTTDNEGLALMPEPIATPVRVLAIPDDLFDCRKLSDREAMPAYNLQQTASKGLVSANRCDAGARATAEPGQLTLFARPLRWYEQLNRGLAQ